MDAAAIGLGRERSSDMPTVLRARAPAMDDRIDRRATRKCPCVAVFHGVDYLAVAKHPRATRQKSRRNPVLFEPVDDIGDAFKHVRVGNPTTPKLIVSTVISRPLELPVSWQSKYPTSVIPSAARRHTERDARKQRSSRAILQERLGEACGVRSGSNQFFVGSRGLFPARHMWGLTVP